MYWKSIVLFILFIIIIGVFGWYYFNYEKPKQEEANAFINLSIFALDENLNQVKTGFSLFVDGGHLISGETFENAGLIIKVPINTTIIINGRNLENQTYYFTKANITTKINDSFKRLNLRVSEAKEVLTHFEGDLTFSDKINVILQSDNFRNIGFCIERSYHFVFVETNKDYKKIENPERFKDYDDCYYTNKSLSKDSKLIIPLVLNSWKSIDDSAFIEIVVFDSQDGKNFNNNAGKDYKTKFTTEWNSIFY